MLLSKVKFTFQWFRRQSASFRRANSYAACSWNLHATKIPSRSFVRFNKGDAYLVACFGQVNSVKALRPRLAFVCTWNVQIAPRPGGGGRCTRRPPAAALIDSSLFRAFVLRCTHLDLDFTFSNIESIHWYLFPSCRWWIEFCICDLDETRRLSRFHLN